jgi:hypothetical protein
MNHQIVLENGPFDLESMLSEMACDDDIRRELKEIAEDFLDTELDGLPE